MSNVSKGLGLSCLVLVALSGFGLGHPAARAQEPSADDTGSAAPSPDASTGTSAGTDADTDADTGTGTGTDAGTDAGTVADPLNS